MKVVLLDGPDFQALSERANHLFLAMKLSFGPTGIEVHYPDALAHELSEKTRIPVEGVRDALEELRATGWLDWERNVFWILGQLEHEPHFNPQNKKHQTSVQSHVGGLPRLSIVRRFIDRYSPYFEGAPDSLSDSLPDSPTHSPSHSPSKQGVGSRDEGGGSTTKSPSLRSVDFGADAPSDEQTEEELDPKAIRAEVIPLVRKHLWLGRDPPPGVLEKEPKWGMGREADIAIQWLKAGDVADLEEACGLIRYARHALDIDGPLSLLFLNSKEYRDRFQEALQYARREVTRRAARETEGDGPARIGEGIEGVAGGR